MSVDEPCLDVMETDLSGQIFNQARRPSLTTSAGAPIGSDHHNRAMAAV